MWPRAVSVTMCWQCLSLSFDLWKASVLPKFHERTQGLIQSLIHHLRWRFLQKRLTAFNKKFYHSCLTKFLIKCASIVGKVPLLGTSPRLKTCLPPIYLRKLFVTGVIFSSQINLSPKLYVPLSFPLWIFTQ